MEQVQSSFNSNIFYCLKRIDNPLDPRARVTCGLYYKHVTILNDASSGVNKLKAWLNDAARGIIYDRHVFIIQATG